MSNKIFTKNSVSFEEIIDFNFKSKPGKNIPVVLVEVAIQLAAVYGAMNLMVYVWRLLTCPC